MTEHNHIDYSSHHLPIKNNLRQRLTQLTSCAHPPPRDCLSNLNHNLNCVFSISSQMYSSPLVPNQNRLSSKKKGLRRTIQKSGQGRKNGTPFQERKIQQRQKSSKIFSRVLQNSGKRKELQKTQGKWLIVKQISGSCEDKQHQEKQGEDIRQTDITYQGSEHKLARYTTDQEEGLDSKQMINSWVFSSSNPQVSKKTKLGQQKHKKMALKELWKHKAMQENSQLFADQHESVIHRAIIYRQKKSQTILSKKNESKVQAEYKQPVLARSKIHSKTFKKAGKLSKYLLESASSALKIKPCNLENSKSSYIKEGQLLSCSLSESKINPRKNEQGKLISKYRSNQSLRKTKPTEEALSKELTGWQYFNDFSQRQGIF